MSPRLGPRFGSPGGFVPDSILTRPLHIFIRKEKVNIPKSHPLRRKSVLQHSGISIEVLENRATSSYKKYTIFLAKDVFCSVCEFCIRTYEGTYLQKDNQKQTKIKAVGHGHLDSAITPGFHFVD